MTTVLAAAAAPLTPVSAVTYPPGDGRGGPSWTPHVCLALCIVCGDLACVADDLCRRHGGITDGLALERGYAAAHRVGGGV